MAVLAWIIRQKCRVMPAFMATVASTFRQLFRCRNPPVFCIMTVTSQAIAMVTINVCVADGKAFHLGILKTLLMVPVAFAEIATCKLTLMAPCGKTVRDHSVLRAVQIRLCWILLMAITPATSSACIIEYL